MSKFNLSICQKIGDISKQIESLEAKLDSENIRFQVVGGIEITSKEELEVLIYFQERRLNILSTLLDASNDKVKESKKSQFDHLCDICQGNQEYQCEKDFFTKSIVNLLGDMIDS